MNDTKELLQRARSQFPPPEDVMDSLIRRRDRKRRNQRIAAGVVGIGIFVTAIWIVTSVGSLDRSETPAVPGPSETGPPVSNCVVTRCTETGPTPIAPEPAYLIDLNTGEMTPLPKSIAGNFGYAVSPDGTMVAYSSHTGTPQIFIASLDGTDVQQVTHDQRGAGEPDWSPDGTAIAYTSGPFPSEEDVTNIFVVDLATGETSQVTHEKPTTLGAAYPQFSPDGTSIVYVRAVPLPHPADQLGIKFRASVRIVPVTGGKSVLLVQRSSFPGTFSPDGSTLAVECPDGICIGDADGTNLRVLVRSRSVEPKWSPDGTRISYINLEYNADGGIFVVDVATGETTFVAEGTASPEWLDDHTLIIRPRIALLIP